MNLKLSYNILTGKGKKTGQGGKLFFDVFLERHFTFLTIINLKMAPSTVPLPPHEPGGVEK
jgi:hypothetical protein